ncbi:unnamed protein product [Kuraishia capsulata CBS 1993]|uniref:Golgi apparatus membrane protein TVP38 n=1 Tax=Kuraishia capsulata CBS 1993 TaxID=1382522 RepID=W6MF34_9ASCO|nr:uncharacterized protein KUCA_T00000154001 [Kuraishia capsulata CBS 1993]CDK24194.1 unnamed protein product [Kuraishia capsulata CBS 1993]
MSSSFQDVELVRSNLEIATQFVERARSWFLNRSLTAKIAIVLACLCAVAGEVVIIVYHHQIIKLMALAAQGWRELKYGYLLMFTLLFCVSFPPVVGYSFLATLSGMIWGCPGGYPVLAAGTVLGSLASFLLFRNVLHARAVRMVEQNKTLKSIALVLTGKNWPESLFILTLLRICPLPYSFSNGALAAAPGLSAVVFTWASIISSPKLFIHLFVGSRLRELSKEKDTKSKVVDFVSILITGISFGITTFYLYGKVKNRLSEMSRQDENLDIEDERVLGLDEINSSD